MKKPTLSEIHPSIPKSPASTTRHPLVPPYPYPYKFLINPQKKCSNRNPFLVILVPIRCHDLESRLTIRQTWGNESNYPGLNVITLFLVGISTVRTRPVQQMLEEESAAFGDIAQQDFLDTYYNLTLKTLMGMEWVSKFCPSASYVAKIDNDMFINVEYLVHQLLRPELSVRTNYFTGDIYSNTGPLRDPAYKWYVPVEVYPNKTYPPYCVGTAYVFSADMARKIYDIAQVLMAIPMEDVYIGICLFELHIPPTNPPGHIFNRYDKYNRCTFNRLIAVHVRGNDELKTIWDDFWAQKFLSC
uniref:Hexosyltransferase n=1 Tax=Leptobrachium leishanense TaxID=445787 RepID=A0A8C5M339_9ANUR